MSGTGVWANVPAQYQSTITAAANKYGIRPELLAAVGDVESGYSPDVIAGHRLSSAGAIGAFQFMPATAAQYGVSATDFNSSANGAAHYLSDLIKQYGSESAALSAYNSGSPSGAPGYAATVLSKAGGTPDPNAPAAPSDGNTATAQPVSLVSDFVDSIFKPLIDFLIEAGMVVGGALLIFVGSKLIWNEST